MDSHNTGPGFKTRSTLSTKLLNDCHHNSIIELNVAGCVERWGGISRSGRIQDIEMGRCVFHCYVPHQWIAQQQVGPVSVYCDGMGCHVLCLWHDIAVLQHIDQSTTATNRHLRCSSDVKPHQTNKSIL